MSTNAARRFVQCCGLTLAKPIQSHARAEHCIVETKVDYPKIDYRLIDPFPQLQHLVDSYVQRVRRSNHPTSCRPRHRPCSMQHDAHENPAHVCVQFTTAALSSYDLEALKADSRKHSHIPYFVRAAATVAAVRVLDSTLRSAVTRSARNGCRGFDPRTAHSFACRQSPLTLV